MAHSRDRHVCAVGEAKIGDHGDGRQASRFDLGHGDNDKAGERLEEGADRLLGDIAGAIRSGDVEALRAVVGARPGSIQVPQTLSVSISDRNRSASALRANVVEVTRSRGSR